MDLHLNPDTAVDLRPRPMSTKIYYVPECQKVLKTGRGVTVAEADAMRLVAAHTKIPVPQVFEAYEEGETGYIWMSKIEGRTLFDIWSTLSQEGIDTITKQLLMFITELRSIKEAYFGRAGRQQCQDIFFSHMPRFGDQMDYGPYTGRTAYNAGLAEVLQRSRPTGKLSDSDVDLVRKLQDIKCEDVVFTHGDLHMSNILISDTLEVVGILDWEHSSFSIFEREYFEAKSRARDTQWIAAIEKFIPSIPEEQYLAFLELEQQLVVYSGF